MEHSLSLTQGQRHVLRELRVVFGLTSDEDTKAQVNVLEKAFRGPITTALNQDLNTIGRNGISGFNLLKMLIDLYHRHNVREWQERQAVHQKQRPVPRVVCSEALI